MKTTLYKPIAICMTIILLLPITAVIREASAQQPPPVAAPLVREGAFAMQLAEALNLGQTSSETEAESMLGAAGVAPRTGWMADYPVTPDIIGELRDSIIYATQAGTLAMDQTSALTALQTVQTNVTLSVTPAPAGPPNISAEEA